MQAYPTSAITMQLYVSYETPFQLHRPDSVAAAVTETDLVTVSWRERRTYIFNQSSRLYDVPELSVF